MQIISKRHFRSQDQILGIKLDKNFGADCALRLIKRISRFPIFSYLRKSFLKFHFLLIDDLFDHGVSVDLTGYHGGSDFKVGDYHEQHAINSWYYKCEHNWWINRMKNFTTDREKTSFIRQSFQSLCFSSQFKIEIHYFFLWIDIFNDKDAILTDIVWSVSSLTMKH